MKKPPKIRILVVDDHFVVRTGLRSSIDMEPNLEVIAEASTGMKAIELFRRLRPDLVLMDLRLPDLTGSEVTRRLVAEFPDAKVMILSTYDASENVYRALQAGARAYVQKNCERSELMAAINTVQAGGRHLSQTIAAGLAERLGRQELTSRELDVLRLIATGKSNKEIGSCLALTETTVKLHVRSILGKMAVNDRTQAVTAGVRLGLLQID